MKKNVRSEQNFKETVTEYFTAIPSEDLKEKLRFFCLRPEIITEPVLRIPLRFHRLQELLPVLCGLMKTLQKQ